MSQRPTGVEAPCEAGLRALASKRGPSPGRLASADEYPSDADPELRELMQRTESMYGVTARERATALWEIIQEEVAKIVREEDDPRLGAAVQAAFRMPMETYRGREYDSVRSRLARAKETGVFEPTNGQAAPNRFWRLAVRKLGFAVEKRLVELERHPDGWVIYQTRPDEQSDEPPPPQDAQPVFVDRLVATYLMRGRAVRQAITERLVTAREDGVDHYVVRAYSPLAGKHNVLVEALLNCRGGEVESFARRGGATHEVPMYAPHALRRGEQWFFASRVGHQQGADEEPIVEIQVTSHGIAPNGLTMRVQFEDGFHPSSAWWFANVPENRQLVKPADGHRRRIDCSPFGYLEHTFTELCRPLCKYGLGWEW